MATDIIDFINKYTLKSSPENYPSGHPFRKYELTINNTSDNLNNTYDFGDNYKNNWPHDLYAKNFSNHLNPQSIYPRIQFRVGSKTVGEDTVPNWVDLNAHKHNTFFKDLNIEDLGGVQKLSMNLYDKDFSNLETVIRGAVATAQLLTGEAVQSKVTNKTTADETHNREVLSARDLEIERLDQQKEIWNSILGNYDKNDEKAYTNIVKNLEINNLNAAILKNKGFIPKSSSFTWITDITYTTNEPTSGCKKDIETACNILENLKTVINNTINTKAEEIANKNVTDLESDLGWVFQYFIDPNSYFWKIPEIYTLPIRSDLTKGKIIIGTSEEETDLKLLILKRVFKNWFDTQSYFSELNLHFIDDETSENNGFYIKKKTEGRLTSLCLGFKFKKETILVLKEVEISNEQAIIYIISETDIYGGTVDYYGYDFSVYQNIGRAFGDLGYAGTAVYNLNRFEEETDLKNILNSIPIIAAEKLLFNETNNSMYPGGENNNNYFINRNNYYITDNLDLSDYSKTILEKRIKIFESLLSEKEYIAYRQESSIQDDNGLSLVRYLLEIWIPSVIRKIQSVSGATIIDIDDYLSKVKINPFEYNVNFKPQNFDKFWFFGETDNYKNVAYYLGQEKIQQAINDILRVIKTDLLEKIIEKESALAAHEEVINVIEQQQDAIRQEAQMNLSKNIELLQVNTTIQSNLKVSIGYTDLNSSFQNQRDDNNTENASDDSPTDSGSYDPNTRGDLWNKYFGTTGSDARWNEVSSNDATTQTIDNNLKWDSIVLKRNQNVIRSLTFDYFITNVKSKITREGLYYTIEAFSLTSELINKYKLVQKYAVLQGTPKKMLASLMKVFNEDMKMKPTDTSTHSTMYLAWGDPEISITDVPTVWKKRTDSTENESDTAETVERTNTNNTSGFSEDADRTTETGERHTRTLDEVIMTIPLGGEASLMNPNLYKPVSSILNEFCAKFPMYSEYIGEDGKTHPEVNVNVSGQPIDSEGRIISSNPAIQVRQTDGTYKDSVVETNLKKYPLTWAVQKIKNPDTSDPTERIIVWFYYKKPRKFRFIRNYDWGRIDSSVVKTLEIENKSEYATMSSVVIYQRKQSDSLSSDELLQNISIYGINSTDNINKNSDLLVNKVMPSSTVNNSSAYYNAIQEAYNRSVYEGQITVVGDPGLFTNTNLCPYLYPIKINIYTPGYGSTEIMKTEDDGTRTGTGRFVAGEITQLNYMSGVYVITGFKHNISSSGYTTTIGVMRYPGLDEEVLGDKTGSEENNNSSLIEIFEQRRAKFLNLDSSINVDGTPTREPDNEIIA